jgi:hypothetical protein
MYFIVIVLDCDHLDLTAIPGTNCTYFYRCGGGGTILYKFACPATLQFNEKIKVCDWPWDANCRDEIGETDGNNNSTPLKQNGSLLLTFLTLSLILYLNIKP